MQKKQTGKNVIKVINIFYFSVAAVVAIVLPTTYFIEDYLGEKAEVKAWTEFQASVINRAVERDPGLWPFELRQLLNLIESQVPDDDDDATNHIILDGEREVIVTVPTRKLPWPTIIHDRSLYLGNFEIGYYRVERTLQGLVFETLIVAFGGFLLAIIIVFPLRGVSLRALRQAMQELEKEKEKALVTLRSIGDAVITTDAKLQVQYLNPIAEELTGWTNSQSQGVHVDFVLNITDAEGGRSNLSASKNPFPANALAAAKTNAVLVRQSDKKKFYIENSIAPIRNEEGSVIGTVMVFHDMTERRESEELLRSSQMRSENALSIAQLGTFEWDLQTEDAQCSQRTREIYEFTGNEGSRINDYLRRIVPDDIEDVHRAMEISLNNDGSLHFECRISLPYGGIRHIVSRSTCEKDQAGTWTRRIGVVNDITERKDIEGQLKDADRRKDEFLAMLAHELRNPLAPISAAAQLLRISEPNINLVNQASDIIERQVGHISNLVDDLLDISRIAAGSIKLSKVPLDLNHIIEPAVEQVMPLMKSRDHHLELKLSPENALVDGDQKRLVQVIANLLTNAAKYTPEGGHILLRTDVHEDQVLLSVTDNGIGIAPDWLNHVFELFAQVECTPDRASGGLGLGLTLVKNLVELHGGRVTCFSEGPGKGSTFNIFLPRLAG